MLSSAPRCFANRLAAILLGSAIAAFPSICGAAYADEPSADSDLGAVSEQIGAGGETTGGEEDQGILIGAEEPGDAVDVGTDGGESGDSAGTGTDGDSGDGAGTGTDGESGDNTGAGTDNPGGDNPGADDPDEPETPSGLVEIDGQLYYFTSDGTALTDTLKAIEADGTTVYYYFTEDGTAYTGGYKPLSVDGVRAYYYFTEDGTAYTDGYLTFEQGGKDYCFFFQPDGTAYTGGYKEIELDGETCYFYFLANGQAFNTGYKTVMIDGKKHYFFFGSDFKAITDSLESIDLSERVGYFYLEHDGRAFTEGYKEIGQGEDTKFYYFLSNGQAYTTGYKVVKIDGESQYFFFQPDGTAYTGGRKDVSFGSSVFYYFFGADGRALLDQVVSDGGERYYYGPNGRACAAWHEIDGAWYRSGSDGKFLSDTVVEGYRITADGTCPTKARIHELVSGLVTDDMTDQEKICTLFDWVVDNDMTYITNNDHFRTDWTWYAGWVDDFTVEIFNNNGGNCFRYAALLGVLLREGTGLDVRVICGRTPTSPGVLGSRINHGWVEVYQNGDWYIYDAEMVKFVWYTAQRWKGYQRLHGTGYDHLSPYIITDLYQ